MNRTGVVSHPLYIEHDPGPGHPESPDRLRAIYSLIEREGLLAQCVRVEPRPATRDEICRIHDPGYYEQVQGTDGRAVALDPDTSTSPESFKAAELAAGGTLALVEELMAGRIDNGYALVRPPGHHAERSRAMGFCLFNNVAIAAEHAIRNLGAERVLIADWDLHHGNGTMHSFYGRRNVLYFSTHQFPYYPGTGSLDQVGEGEGAGYTINVPLTTGMGDLEYRAVLRQVLAPVAARFAPDLILVSTGFDTYRADPLGGMQMSAEGYGTLTAEMMEMAARTAKGRLGLVLEGGYDLEGLSQGVATCLRAMLGTWAPPTATSEAGRAAKFIDAVREAIGGYWKL